MLRGKVTHMLKHYVGITGITTQNEAKTVINCFSRAGVLPGATVRTKLVGPILQPDGHDLRSVWLGPRVALKNLQSVKSFDDPPFHRVMPL